MAAAALFGLLGVLGTGAVIILAVILVVILVIIPLAVIAGAVEPLAVEDEAQHLHPGQLRRLQSLADLAVVGIILADDEEAAGRRVGQGQGVGDDVDRRRVDEHQIIVLLGFLQDVPHLLGREDLGRVGRQLARRQDIQAVPLGLENRLVQGAQPDQHIRQAGEILVIPEDIPLAGAAQVAVDQEHLLLRHGAGDGQIRGDRGFALAGDGAGDDHGVALLAHEGEEQVHAQLGVIFQQLHGAVLLQEEISRVLMLLLRPADRGQHRRREVFIDLLRVRDLPVQEEDQRQDRRRQHRAAQGAGHRHAGQVHAVRPGGHCGIVHDLDAAGADHADDLRRGHVNDRVADVRGHLGIPGAAGHAHDAGLGDGGHADGSADVAGGDLRILGRQPLGHHVHDLVALDDDGIGVDQAHGGTDVAGAGVAVVDQVRVAVVDIHRAGGGEGLHRPAGPVPVHAGEADRRAQDHDPDVFQHKQQQFHQVNP